MPSGVPANGLTGQRIVVTRAVPQARSLLDAIEAAGGSTVALPLLEIVDTADGGVALAEAVRDLGPDDWLVVLSPNGARRIVAQPATDSPPKLAVIAGGTGEVFATAGWSVDLVPDVASSVGLLAAFADIAISGSVLIAQAEGGRRELADGLRERGVNVEVVAAYRNVMPELDGAAVASALSSDAVVFASPSAVERYVSHIGLSPSRAVCIGAVTAQAAKAAGFDVSISSAPTVDAIVTALAV